MRVECKLSVGTEMEEAYGDKAAATSNQFFSKFTENPSRKPSDRQHILLQLERSVRG